MNKSMLLSAVMVALVQPFLLSAANHKPNIILFIADDHGWADSGIYGDRTVQTPNIDRLAATSMRFDSAFAASPLCSPSRCVIQTGLMPHRNGGHKFGTSIKAGLKTMAAYFNDMGYETAHFGKFHHASPKAWFPYSRIDSSRDTRPAVDFLSGYKKDKPLLLVVCSYPPHTPWVRNTAYDPARIKLPPNFVDTPETRSDRADYYSDVTLMDSFLGDILEAAENNGLYEDTLFIYTSDQGANWPFAKWCVYDQGLRVPFVARWPGKITPGSTTDAMINLVDLLPTCIDVAGGTLPDSLDGRSFASVLLGHKDEHRKQIFGTHTGNDNGDAITVNHCPARTVRDRRFRYIFNLDPETTFNTHITGCKSGPHHLRHWDSWTEKAKTDDSARRLVHAYQHRPAEELYDLEKDPYEMENLAANPQYRDILEGMRKDLSQWRASQNDFEQDYPLAAVSDSPKESPMPIAQAQWIAAEKPGTEEQRRSPGVHASASDRFSETQTVPLPIFRKSFMVKDAPVSNAEVVVCGLGHFELSVNGTRVGDHFLDPPWSDYADTCYTVRFDVAELLAPGENVLGVMLGNGMYNVKGGRYTKFTGSYGPPKLTLCLAISQGDKQQIIHSDASWKTDAGPVTFSCIYGGEDYDARREQPGWDSPGFDDSLWNPVTVVDGPGGKLRPATSPPVKVIRHLEPVSITKLKDGRYEIDLGENLSAYPVIKVKGQAGRRVTIETAEQKGKPWQGHSYTLTLKGDTEPEVFAPRFTYFGFQYLYVSGVVWGDDINSTSGVPALIEIGADFVSSCGPRIGTFACSNPLLNEIDDMIDRSVASNLQHVLTDCPHREKLGWLEVSHLMGPSILLNYDMGELYRKICRDTTDSQLDNGLVPDIAPEYVRFNAGFFESPEWGSAAVQLPWLLYQWYGDASILREQYSTMARYTDYLTSTRDDLGLVKGGLGDWYDWTPEKGHVGSSQLTPNELPATAILYDNARILLKTATMQGRAADAQKWEGLMHEVRRDFLGAYYDEPNKTVATGSQCALALGLYFGLVPDQDRGAVVANLVENLEENQYRQSTGEVSFRYLVLALAQAGRSDVVYRMINRTDAPGYGCMLKQHGLATLSERWDRPGSSLNHCMFGHIQEWFQRYILGIRQAPGSTGYDKVLIDPFVPDGLDWAAGSFDSPNGRIEVAWTRKGSIVEVTIKAERAEVVAPPVENRRVKMRPYQAR